MRPLINACLLSLIAAVTCVEPTVAHTDSSPAQAYWIWYPGGVAEGDDASFQKTFATSVPVTRATLRCVGEYTGLTLSLNNKTLAVVEPYDPLLSIDVTNSISMGDHLLEIRCDPIDGPSAFFAVLDLDFAGGSHQSIATDSSWMTSSVPDAGLVPSVALETVSRKLLTPESRRVGITATDNYEQWKQALGSSDNADPATFQVAEGFEIRLVRIAKGDEDSWVSMLFDPRGRLIIAKEQKGLLRMTLATDGNSVTKTEELEDSLEECRGLAWIENQLYANANNSKGLFRLREAEDGTLGPAQLLLATSGRVGHGRNDLCIGPDRKLYSIHGDSVDLPTSGINHTSPLREASRGEKTSEGHLLKIDPETGEPRYWSPVCGIRSGSTLMTMASVSPMTPTPSMTWVRHGIDQPESTTWSAAEIMAGAA